jgi:hypothetical protein
MQMPCLNALLDALLVALVDNRAWMRPSRACVEMRTRALVQSTAALTTYNTYAARRVHPFSQSVCLL